MFGIRSTRSRRPQHTTSKTSFRPQLKELEKREVMSVAHVPIVVPPSGGFAQPGPNPPTAAGLALINSLPDTPVRTTALADYQRDGLIGRDDTIDILYHGTDQFQFLTGAELTSLRTLISQGATLDMPGYVQNLASKVLRNTGLGTVGAQHLGQNVDNFFLGQVLPALPSTNDTYVPFSEPLWNPVFGPSYVDVSEGTAVRDSWLISTLREVAYRDPAGIMNMFVDNGDGTYSVRFFVHGVADWVTVDNELPARTVNLNGQTGFEAVAASPDPYLWVALAEKAFAQENAVLGLGTSSAGPDAYQALNFGTPKAALTAITGLSSTYTTGINASAIADAWSKGKFVLLSTGHKSSTGPFDFYTTYAVVNVSATTVTLAPLDHSYYVEVDDSVLGQYFVGWTQAGKTLGHGASVQAAASLPDGAAVLFVSAHSNKTITS